MSDRSEGFEKKHVLATYEDGIVLPGSQMVGFEDRVIRSVRKPFFSLLALMAVMFVLLIGGAIFLRHLDDAISNTDQIVTEVAGPEARRANAEQQKEFIKTFSEDLNCDQQNNLQRFVDQLVVNGFSEFDGVNVIKAPCTKRE